MTASYPPDEFDRFTGPGSRRGAHRSRPHPATALLPALMVLAVVALVLVGVNTLLGSRPPQSAATGVGPVGADIQPGATDTPAAPATTAPGPSPSATTSAAPTQTQAPVDRDAPVTVLNGTTTAGLATQAADALTGAGWKVASTGNHRSGTAPPTTTVYYADEDLEATAQAVADDLGGAEVALDGELAASVTVVLGEDYAG